MIDGKIYQGEPFNIKVSLFDDDGETQLKASNYKIDMLLRKDSVVIKIWSNHKSQFDGKEVHELEELNNGMEYQANVSEAETKMYPVGNYSYELRVTEDGKPSISIERNIVRVLESTIKNMTL